MSYIISIFSWIWRLLETACRWLADMPGKIVLFVMTFVTTLLSVIQFFVSNIGTVKNMVDSASSSVSSISQYIGNSSYGGTLAYALSLDVMGRYVVSVGGIFLGCISSVVLVLFSYALTCWVLPMAFLCVQKLISLVSAGFVKT